MNLPWVCASCRRHLLHRYQRQLRLQQRATYISFEQGNETPAKEQTRGQASERHKRFNEPRKISSVETKSRRNIPTLELLQSAENEFMDRLLANANNGRKGTGGLYSRKLLKEPIPQQTAAPESRRSPHPIPPPSTRQMLQPLPSSVAAFQGLREYNPPKEGSILTPRTKVNKLRARKSPLIDAPARPKSSAIEGSHTEREEGAPTTGATDTTTASSPGTISSSSPRWGRYAPETQITIPASQPPTSPIGFHVGESSDGTQLLEAETAQVDATETKGNKHSTNLYDQKMNTGSTTHTQEDTSWHQLAHLEGQPTVKRAKEVRTRMPQARPTNSQLDRKVGRAIESRDPGQIESLWNKLCTSGEGLQHGSSSWPALCTQFLTAFMAVLMPNRALEVWNTMVKEGVVPDIRAWDAMLKGCGLAKSAEAVDDIWRRFLQSGITPDAQIWATRIHALTVSGHWESGIAAFQEMASDWISAVKKGHKKELPQDLKTLGDYNDVPKPNTFVLNGLITGLARGKKHEHIEKVFNWAQRLGITMDAHSFNPILASAVRRGDGATGMEILDQMKSVGAVPDIATYTLLLQLLFRRYQAPPSITLSSPPSQPTTTSLASSHNQAAAASLLQMMHSNGIDANPYTYATLISGVLHNLHSSPADNLSAAYAVLTYMESQSIPMSSQVYTNFLSHHFSQSPPDLAAVEGLWSRARQDRLVFLDAFFFDRLIEGFAKCSEVGKMMAALGHASKRGKVPSWRAMAEVIKALVNDGDHLRAAEIVASVKKEDMDKDQRRPKTGRSTFWQTVHELRVRVNDEVEIRNGESVNKDSSSATIY